MCCLRKYCYRGKKLPRANKDLDTSVKTRQFISRKGGSREQYLWRVVVAVLLTAAVFYSANTHLYTPGYAGGCALDTPSPTGLPRPWPWGPKLAPDIPSAAARPAQGPAQPGLDWPKGHVGHLPPVCHPATFTRGRQPSALGVVLGKRPPVLSFNT